MAQKKKDAPVEAKEPAEEKASFPQGNQPVTCFFTATGVRVNSENQPIDENGTILDEKPLPRG